MSNVRTTNMAVDTLRLGNQVVQPASVEGSSNVFTQHPFTLNKNRWMPDAEALVCPLCNNKFTQMRRKHHCRQCGRVLCNKCCDSKLALPQLGYDDPQKVCDYCLPVSQLVAKARTSEFAKKVEAAQKLASLTTNPDSLAKVVELGGVQTLIFLAQSIDAKIKAAVANALHVLATHTVLHSYLCKHGVLKAISSILANCNEKEENTLINAISAMMVLCKTKEFKAKAIDAGVLPPILRLCTMKENIALLSLMTLSSIVEDQGTLPALIEKNTSILVTILVMATAKDQKMKEISLKILASLSLGNEWHRHRIIQEQYANGNIISNVLKEKNCSQQVLVNAACLVGNLATCQNDQSSLQECLQGVAKLMKSHPKCNDIQVHVARSLANFARYSSNTTEMMNYVDDIIQIHLKSSVSNIHLHGLRTIMSLMNQNREKIIAKLKNNGIEDFFKILCTAEGVNEAVQGALVKLVKERSNPMVI